MKIARMMLYFLRLFECHINGLSVQSQGLSSECIHFCAIIYLHPPQQFTRLWFSGVWETELEDLPLGRHRKPVSLPLDINALCSSVKLPEASNPHDSWHSNHCKQQQTYLLHCHHSCQAQQIQANPTRGYSGVYRPHVLIHCFSSGCTTSFYSKQKSHLDSWVEVRRSTPVKPQ